MRFRGLLDAQRQIVVIEHGLSAGILGKSVERVLRALEIGRHGLRRAAGEHADAAIRSVVASPSGACATSPRASIG